MRFTRLTPQLAIALLGSLGTDQQSDSDIQFPATSSFFMPESQSSTTIRYLSYPADENPPIPLENENIEDGNGENDEGDEDDGLLYTSCPSRHPQSRLDFVIATLNGSNEHSCLVCIDLEIITSVSRTELERALESESLSPEEREALMGENWRMYRLISHFSWCNEALPLEALVSLPLEAAPMTEEPDQDQCQELRDLEVSDSSPSYTPSDLPEYSGSPSSPDDHQSYQVLYHGSTEFSKPPPLYTIGNPLSRAESSYLQHAPESPSSLGPLMDIRDGLSGVRPDML